MAVRHCRWKAFRDVGTLSVQRHSGQEERNGQTRQELKQPHRLTPYVIEIFTAQYIPLCFHPSACWSATDTAPELILLHRPPWHSRKLSRKEAWVVNYPNSD